MTNKQKVLVDDGRSGQNPDDNRNTHPLAGMHSPQLFVQAITFILFLSLKLLSKQATHN